MAAKHRTPLEVDQAAEYLGVSPRFIRRLVHDRRVPFLRLGRHIRLRPEDLDAYVEAGLVEPIGPMR